MTPSSTQNNEAHGRSSHRNEDTDWVVVKAGADTTREDFELIDSAEARCWCGGSDAELCCRKGHRWPLCTVDRGEELSREQPNEISDQSHDEGENYKRRNTNCGGNHDDKQSSANESNQPQEKPAPPPTTAPPTLHEIGPFTKLAVLTDLMDPEKRG